MTNNKKDAQECAVIINRLRSVGARITKIRQILVKLFLDSACSLSVPEITQILNRQKLYPHKTTLYREIEFLKKNKIISEIQFAQEREKRYCLATEQCHHHLVCSNCGTVEIIEVPKVEEAIKSLEQKTKKKHGFAIDHHSLEFFGKCLKCR